MTCVIFQSFFLLLSHLKQTHEPTAHNISASAATIAPNVIPSTSPVPRIATTLVATVVLSVMNTGSGSVIGAETVPVVAA